MLRQGFLGLPSDWIANFLDIHPRHLDTAMEKFGMGLLLKNEEDTEKLGALFSEWLVFDYTSAAFGGVTGLAYFCSRNPLGLSEVDMAAYRQMLDFKVGYFEVVTVRPAQSVELRDMEGALYDVVDINSSMNLAAGETIWTRIAQISGLYYMVGSQVLRPPFTYSPGMKKVIQGWGKNSVDAKHAASMMYGGEQQTDAHVDNEYVPEAEAAKKFDVALASVGMHDMISSETVRKWVNNERKFPIGFAMKAIFFLMPEDLTEKQRGSILPALQTYLINLPRKSLKGKTPLQVSAEQKPEDRHLEIDMYSYEDYAGDVHGANALMPKEPKKAYVAYEHLIQRLLGEKVPLVTAFRIFANAGLCLVTSTEMNVDALGFELIRASLRLNPLYDFGIRQRERYIDPIEDFSTAPKKDVPLLKNMYAIVQQDGVRRYRRTAFRRYEDFLKESGISLKYKTKTIPSIFKVTGEKLGKIGRNEPCPCGSGKKFKKCCGH